MASFVSGSKPEPEPEPAPAPKLDAATIGDEVSVDELNAVYLADKLGAHARFTDKTLTVTGVVEKVFVRDHLEIRYIVLTGTQKPMVWPVRCSFGKESVSQLSRLKEKQTVKVRGKYDGYSKNIILKDCVLVS